MKPHTTLRALFSSTILVATLALQTGCESTRGFSEISGKEKNLKIEDNDLTFTIPETGVVYIQTSNESYDFEGKIYKRYAPREADEDGNIELITLEEKPFSTLQEGQINTIGKRIETALDHKIRKSSHRVPEAAMLTYFILSGYNFTDLATTPAPSAP